MDAKASVLLIDDHPIVRDGFRHLLQTTENFTVLDECGNGQQALKLARDKHFDLIVVDYALPDIKGPELVQQLKAISPMSKMVMVSMYDNDPFVNNAIHAGAVGYVSKRCAAEELILALESVTEGNTYLSDDVMKNLRFNKDYQHSGLPELTAREFDTFICLARGLGVKGTASKLDVMPKTIHTHRASILDKLKAKNDFELLQLALKHNLLTFAELVQ